MPCFDNLPVELYEEILTIAAWDASESDKRWLCLLTTTSRRVLSIVRPVLYDTVGVTTMAHTAASLLSRVLAAAPYGHFGLTRRLWVDVAPDHWDRHGLGSIFPNVQHFSASLYFLERGPASFHPARLELRTRLWREDWPWLSLAFDNLKALRNLTHLRLAMDPYGSLPAHPATLSRSPALALQYIVLESSAPGWDPQRLLTDILPFFLSSFEGPSASLKRLLVCATARPLHMQDAFALIHTYAAEHRERRLWVLDTPTDGIDLAQYRPGVTFDDAQWTAGRPLYTGA